jgi:cytochrome P450
MTSTYGPVSDWATDLDHVDPSYNRNAPTIWREIRESGCPIAHSDRYHGMWVPLTHEHVAEVAYDTETFTSRGVVVSRGTIDDFPEGPIGGAPPITSDPPFHHHARRVLLPPFAPKAIQRWEPEMRAQCGALADAIADGAAEFDGSLQYAQHVPVDVIARMLGLPLEDDDLFRTFVHNALEASTCRPTNGSRTATSSTHTSTNASPSTRLSRPTISSPTCSGSSCSASVSAWLT